MCTIILVDRKQGEAMKLSLILASLLLWLAAAGAAQSNEFMDGLLEAKTVTVGQASYLVLGAAEKLGESDDASGAFARLQELGWAPKAAAAEDPISYSSYAYLLMRAFELKGGVMYSLFHSPRYAYRELASRQMIQGRSDPKGKPDGQTALRVLSRVLDAEGRAK
jgi:hypothetical protein